MDESSVLELNADDALAARLSIATGLMTDRRWAEASAKMGDGDLPLEWQLRRNLARNLADLSRHRPEVYRAIMAAPASQRYEVAMGEEGRPTVHHRMPDGRATSLSPGNDPMATLRDMARRIAPSQRQGHTLGLYGMGDGYLLNHLAHSPPKLFRDREQTIHLIEPELAAVMPCLMVHDYSGDCGPIVQKRFVWAVGPDWLDRWENRALADLHLPLPKFGIGLGMASAAVEAGVATVLAKVLELDAGFRRMAEEHYAGVSDTDTAAALTGRGGRRPRALLLTTRFSTVLQHSTRDMADALERLGVEARVIIEPSNHHDLTVPAVRQALAEFRPDVAIQIDHHRAEQGDLFPPNLPFVCWGQDHLPNLLSADAGRAMGRHDFFITDGVDHYCQAWGYPARQCLAMGKLTRVDPTVDAPAQDEDVTFVSNASGDPATLIAAIEAEFSCDPATRRVAIESARRMMAVYESGDCLPHYWAVKSLALQVERELGPPLDATAAHALGARLMHPLNNALYRQQAARWAMNIAARRGMALGLYGEGWTENPQFAPLARGAVAYGEPLADLTRRTRINLQIVPFLGLHQRLLDGLACGGFFLIRKHPVDAAMATLAKFLCDHPDAVGRTTDSVVTALPPGDHAIFAAMVDTARPTVASHADDDPTPLARQWIECGLLDGSGELLPCFNEVCFGDESELAALIARFIDDPAGRDRMASLQHAAVIERFGYERGMRRMLDFVAERLSESNIHA